MPVAAVRARGCRASPTRIWFQLVCFTSREVLSSWSPQTQTHLRDSYRASALSPFAPLSATCLPCVFNPTSRIGGCIGSPVGVTCPEPVTCPVPCVSNTRLRHGGRRPPHGHGSVRKDQRTRSTVPAADMVADSVTIPRTTTRHSRSLGTMRRARIIMSCNTTNQPSCGGGVR